MAKTDKELAVELAGVMIEAGFDREKLPGDSLRYYSLQLNKERVVEIVRACYDAIHALPEDKERTE